MTEKKPAAPKDRVKNRKDIGAVEPPIERLLKFRAAEASCVHIEAALETERGLTGRRDRSKR